MQSLSILNNERTCATLLLSLVVTLLYADQNLLAPNLSAIASEFGYNDKQKDRKLGGELAFGFFLLGAPVSILIGYFADILNRQKLFLVVMLLGEISCMATYWTENYNQLFVTRTLTGISMGGAIPIIFSLLADYYSPQSRINVSTIIGISMGLGTAIGQLLSGYLGPLYGWRLPFLVVPIPAILSIIIFYLTVKEPSRGGQEELNLSNTSSSSLTYPIHQRLNHYNKLSLKKTSKQVSVIFKELFGKLNQILHTPTLLLAYLQGIPGCVPWGVVTVYLNDYLSHDIGFTVIQATFFIIIFGLGGFVGLALGGAMGQSIYNVNKGRQCLFMGISSILGAIPLLILLNISSLSPPNNNATSTTTTSTTTISAVQYLATSILEDDSFIRKSTSAPIVRVEIDYLWVYLSMSFLGGAISSITGPNIRSVIQNVSTPDIRGTAFSFFTLTDDVGKGGGPMVVAWLIYLTGSRQLAFSIGVCGWLLCGVIICFMSLTVTKDEAAVTRKIHHQLLTNQNIEEYSNHLTEGLLGDRSNNNDNHSDPDDNGNGDDEEEETLTDFIGNNNKDASYR